MAIYGCRVTMIQRSKGHNIMATVAYRSGEKLHSDYNGKTYDYTEKKDVIYSQIMLTKDAPKEYQDRQTFWKAVQESEKRKDSQEAREILILLPKEFEKKELIEVTKDYVNKILVDKGMCADIAIHDKGDGNPHAHILLTTREVSEEGFKGKGRNWNNKKELESWREDWATICNKHLKLKGINQTIYHTTLKEQGINRIPNIHLGRATKQMQEKGIETERLKQHNEIYQQNKQLKVIEDKIKMLETNKKRSDELMNRLNNLTPDDKENKTNVLQDDKINKQIEKLKNELKEIIGEPNNEDEEKEHKKLLNDSDNQITKQEARKQEFQKGYNEKHTRLHEKLKAITKRRGQEKERDFNENTYERGL